MQLNWLHVERAVDRLCDHWQHEPQVVSVFGIPTGGCFVALLAATRLDLPMVDEPGTLSLVLDDLIDSGETLRPFVERGHFTDVLFRKPHSPKFDCPTAAEVSGWIKFPWEHEAAPLDAAIRLLQFCGRPNQLIRTEARDLLQHVAEEWGVRTLGGETP